jgi:IS4 transposase
MLVMADRGIYSYRLLTAVRGAGADFALRVTAMLDLPALEWLPDGSYLSYIADPQLKARTANRSRLLKGTMHVTELPGMHVRVVDYDVPGRGKGELFTIVTSVLDYQDLPAPEIAAAYHERWEIELAFDEIETHQRGPAVLRSRSPDLVLQELYGLLITHYAIRQLMTEAAGQAELDPDRLSFTRTLNIVRRQVTAQAAFSPLTTEPGDR